jgi:hypothetical protein
MKLVDNWLTVAKLSWAVRLAILSAVFSALEVAFQLFQGSIPPLVFASIASVLATAAAVARVVHQASLHAKTD